MSLGLQHRLALPAALIVLLALPAMSVAQSIGPSTDPAESVGIAPVGATPESADAERQAQSGGDPDAKDKTLPPPPSLPGSHAHSIPVAPIDKAAAVDMNPTAALFDAINRGDTGAARDALGRGADPEAHNVLGLTPIDLSVDLGRNEISFLLLSLHSAAAATQAGAQAPSHPIKVSAPAKLVPQATGGAPAPRAGFLGFGGS